jgi:hypothetical protein
MHRLQLRGIGGSKDKYEPLPLLPKDRYEPLPPKDKYEPLLLPPKDRYEPLPPTGTDTNAHTKCLLPVQTSKCSLIKSIKTKDDWAALFLTYEMFDVEPDLSL